MNEWISFFIFWILFPLSIISIYEGVNRLTLGKYTATTIILICLGTGFLIGRAGFIYWGYSTIKISAEKMNKDIDIPILLREKFKNFSNEEFSERSKSIASFVFIDSGKIISFVDNSGISVNYSPSKKEIREREIRIRQFGEINSGMSFLLTQIYFLIIATFTAMMAGFIIAKKELEIEENS